MRKNYENNEKNEKRFKLSDNLIIIAPQIMWGVHTIKNRRKLFLYAKKIKNKMSSR